MAQSKLVDIKRLETDTGIPERTLRTLYQGRKISHIKTGHRTILFDPAKVRQELQRVEIKAVA
jgi:hypothetical protein